MRMLPYLNAYTSGILYMYPPNTNVSWDPNLLRLGPSVESRSNGRTRSGRRASSIQGKFILGPIDVSWVCRARELGVTPLLVGLFLWYLRGMRGTNSVVVSNLMMQEWGVQPDAKARALRKLEKARLITVKREGKRSPRVTLVVGNASNSSWRSTRGYRSRKDAAQSCHSLSRFQVGSSNESTGTNL